MSSEMAFKHARLGSFFQTPPALGNPYLGDPFLERILKRLLPSKIFPEVQASLSKLGARVVQEIEPLNFECERNEPILVQFDAWGKRVDRIVTCPAWKRMKEITVEESIISTGYSSAYADFARIVQFAKSMIFHPSSGFYSCPIAMTDGLAKTLKVVQRPEYDALLSRLLTTEPSHFWTSGQWMTERGGGSDVSGGTETLAVKGADGRYRLYGYKWFSSATDSDVALTLARIVEDRSSQGQGPLSMFLLKTRKEDGELNGIQIMKLKNKLGSRSLPTAELLLDGAVADLLSEPGKGVAAISNMLTITRIHNAAGSVAAMRRVLLLARDYSKKRLAFGAPISSYPLHLDTLAEMELFARGGTVLLFQVARLLGRQEWSKSTTEEDDLLRLLTPIAKLYTTKRAMAVVSEGLEAFGGQGYIEDTGLPAILRNAQVTPIWEGTTNVLALDVLRAVAKSRGKVLISFQENCMKRLDGLRDEKLAPAAEKLRTELHAIMDQLPGFSPAAAMARARLIAMSIAEIEIGVLLLEQWRESGVPSDLTTALRWVDRMERWSEKLKDKERFDSASGSREMVFEGYPEEEMTSKL